MFTNKHVLIAVIVAPFLAVLAWFAVGGLLGERPAPAQAGQAYPLVAASNCRWPSGACDLKNTELTLSLRFDDAWTLHLESAHALDGALVSVFDPQLAPSPAPRALQRVGETGRHWRIDGLGRPSADQRIHIATRIAGSQFYGDAASTFAQTPAHQPEQAP